MDKKHYFFVGLGGSGMSAIAQYLVMQGHTVSGSDRSFDNNQNNDVKQVLQNLQINIYPQDGSGVSASVDTLVTSTAIEASIPDVKRALELNITIIKRAQILADIHNKSIGVAVGGTSGKSTVTGMCTHILRQLDANPSVINGGLLLNVLQENLPGLGNVICGDGACVVEADESDGSIELYNPAVAIVTNISLDHKPLAQLRPLFKDFIHRASIGAVVNADCLETMALVGNQNILTFSTKRKADLYACDITPILGGVRFKLNNQIVNLQVLGKHNVSNALSAIAAVSLLGYPIAAAAKALESFMGIRRRLELITKINDITIIDDFAHNPDKITASLEALQEYSGRLIIMFQPHGFGPTKFLRHGLVDAFAQGLKPEDILYMPEIFYAGGSAVKDISSEDLCNDIKCCGKLAIFCNEGRNQILQEIKKQLKPKDRIVIMGARDNSLRDFALEIANSLI